MSGGEKVDEQPDSATGSPGLTVRPLLAALGAIRDPEGRKLSLQAVPGKGEPRLHLAHWGL